MSISKKRFLLPFLFALASPAAARQDPKPPPSGITIHLFGDGAPGLPALSTPQILHQMFVSGDPDQSVARKRSSGKTGELPRPPARPGS